MDALHREAPCPEGADPRDVDAGEGDLGQRRRRRFEGRGQHRSQHVGIASRRSPRAPSTMRRPRSSRPRGCGSDPASSPRTGRPSWSPFVGGASRPWVSSGIVAVGGDLVNPPRPTDRSPGDDRRRPRPRRSQPLDLDLASLGRRRRIASTTAMSSTPSTKVAACGSAGGVRPSIRSREDTGEAGVGTEVHPVRDHPLVRGRDQPVGKGRRQTGREVVGNRQGGRAVCGRRP